MESIAQKKKNCKRYLPHEISTKIHAVETYRQTGDVAYICRKYHVSKASLMRWNKRYDGTRESLMPKSFAEPNIYTHSNIYAYYTHHHKESLILIFVYDK